MGRTRQRGACLWWRPTGSTDPVIGSTIIRYVSKTRTSLMYPMRASFKQVAGTRDISRSSRSKSGQVVSGSVE